VISATSSCACTTPATSAPTSSAPNRHGSPSRSTTSKPTPPPQQTQELLAEDVTDKFDELVAVLDRINIAQVWDAATEDERRTLLDELLGSVTVLPDRLVVEVHGAPPLQVAFGEVGLKSPPDSEFRGVGGGT